MVDDGLGGLAAALQRAGDDSDEWNVTEALAGALGLRQPDLVEPDSGRPTRKHTGGVRRRTSVPHQYHGSHVASLAMRTARCSKAVQQKLV